MKIKRLSKPNGAVIQGAPDRKRFGVPWGKIIYLSVLLFVFANAGQWAFRRVYYIRGPGVMDAVKVVAASDTHLRIKGIPVDINSRVKKGEVLVHLDKSGVLSEIHKHKMDLTRKIMGIRRLQLDAKNKAAALDFEYQALENKVKVLENEYLAADRLACAGAILRSQVVDLELDLSNLKLDLLLTKKKSNQAEEYYNSLEDSINEHKRLAELETAELEKQLAKITIQSPLDGVVTEIFLHEGEVAKIGEPILNVADPEQVFVRAFFSESEQDKIKVDQKVEIIFENGLKSVGIIKRILWETQPLPSEYQKQFGRIDRAVIAEIIPEKKGEWSKYIRLKVDVLINRFF